MTNPTNTKIKQYCQPKLDQRFVWYSQLARLGFLTFSSSFTSHLTQNSCLYHYKIIALSSVTHNSIIHIDITEHSKQYYACCYYWRNCGRISKGWNKSCHIFYLVILEAIHFDYTSSIWSQDRSIETLIFSRTDFNPWHIYRRLI